MVPLRLGAMPSTLQFLLINFQAEDEQIAENFVLGLSRLCHLDPIWPRPGACLQLECGLCICNYLVLVECFHLLPWAFSTFRSPISSPKKILNSRSQSKSFVCLYSVTWCVCVGTWSFCCHGFDMVWPLQQCCEHWGPGTKSILRSHLLVQRALGVVHGPGIRHKTCTRWEDLILGHYDSKMCIGSM